MAVPYTFAGATSSIPLSQLDTNFASTITLGNTAIQLGNTVTTLNNMTLANVTISSGNVTITNVSVTTANVTTGNITTLTSTNATLTNMSSGNVTITGGTINGTTLGATTASSANVTTLTTSSTVTLNGGTANGVAYLNGSKVLTTGSGLVFDGNNLGVGSAPATKLDVSGSAPIARVLGNSGTVPQLQLSSGGVVAWSLRANNDGASDFTIYQDSTQRLKIDSSGNLGIGTSSPGAKLDVNGNISVGNNSGISHYIKQNNDTAIVIYSDAVNQVVFESVRASNTVTKYDFYFNKYGGNSFFGGNLGIGTSLPLSALTVAGTSALNWASFGNSSALATIGTQGTSGASLLVNTASVNSNYASGLAIDGTYSSLVSTVNIKALGVKDAGYSSQLTFSTTSGTNDTERGRFSSDGTFRVKGAGTAGSTDAVQFAGTAPASSLILDSSGNLLVGTTSSGQGRLMVKQGASTVASGVAVQATSNDSYLSLWNDGSVFNIEAYYNSTGSYQPIAFRTSNTERARITSAGSVVVGTAAIATNATDGFLYVPTCAGTPTGTPTTQTGTAPIVIDTTNNKLYFYSGGQWRDAGP